MFNRHLELRLVKNQKSQSVDDFKNEVKDPTFSAKQIEALGKKLMIGTIIVIASTVVLTTLSDIVTDALTNPTE